MHWDTGAPKLFVSRVGLPTILWARAIPFQTCPLTWLSVAVSKLCMSLFDVWFQKISIPPPPPNGWFFQLDPPPPPPRNFRSRGVMHNPHPPGISYFPFHGLNLQYLEIIDRVLLKINCSHLKTRFFMIFDLIICNLLQGNIFYNPVKNFSRGHPLYPLEISTL